MVRNSSQFDAFYKQYGNALSDQRAALFIGAGMSVDAGLPTWPNLLRDTATELKLDVDRETDLVALAQFHLNVKKVRTRLNQLIVEEYGKDVDITRNHRLLANLPIETIWTTNYDQLLEKAFREVGKRCDIRVTKGNFTSPVRGKDVTIYKMHGDVSKPEDAILTKDDYEIYSRKNEFFTDALRGDLVEKTFLFLGFSFTDPNIDYILSRIRLVMGNDAQQHYCVMRWPEKPKRSGKNKAQYDYDMVRLELRISDLKRYGIEALMINDYSEITEILEELNNRSHLKNIFISGSAYNYPVMPKTQVENLSYLLGQETIRQGFNLVSGLGLGIGGNVLIGAIEEFYRDGKSKLTDRVIMRPFPQIARTDPLRKQINSKYRRDMISTSGYTIFMCGNKINHETDEVVSSDGVREEFRLSRELKKFVIPIGATGDVAKEIWDEVMASPDEFFPGFNVQKYLQILGNPDKTNQELVDAIFAIIRLTSTK
ncbi:MAG: SIR2 family protein [bacterium]|nr:SIR2 family protein [bacterium]